MTTIHVLGLDEAGGNMEVAYDSVLQVPLAVETLEVTACVNCWLGVSVLHLMYRSSYLIKQKAVYGW